MSVVLLSLLLLVQVPAPAERSSAGVTVKGRVRNESGAPTSSLRVELFGDPGNQFNSAVSADGTFEISGVGPGKYRVSIPPQRFAQPSHLVVADKDVEMEILLPWTTVVRSRVVTEEGTPVPPLNLYFLGEGWLEIAYWASTPVLQTTLAPGSYGVYPESLPRGASLKSMRAGTIDLLSQPLRITKDTAPPEILVTIALSTPLPLVKVGGRIPGWQPNALVSGIRFSREPNSFDAAIGADGSFEFPKLLPGSYTATLRSSTFVTEGFTVVVPQSDLTALELPFPIVNVSGRVLVEGGGPLPPVTLMLDRKKDALAPPPNLSQVLVIPHGTEFRLHLREDGSFTDRLPAGNFEVTTLIPADGPVPYSVKTITYGSVDLQKQPLRIAATDPSQLLLTLTTPQVSAVKVSGRIVGLTALDSIRNTPAVGLTNDSLLTLMTARVRPDGSFEFPRVYPGSYRLRMEWYDSYPVPVPVNVGTSDVTGVELVIPPRKEIPGRIVVLGGGPMPRANLPMRLPAAAFAPGRGASTSINIDPKPDGTFVITLPVGEHQLSRPGGLPQGYEMKSVTYGSTDVLTGPMKVSESDTAELVITYAYSAPIPIAAVKVRGRVTGLDANTLSRHELRVYMNSSVTGGNDPVQVADDGTFEFPSVYPGNYVATLGGALPNLGYFPTRITVGNSDVTGVTIAIGRQTEIRGRVVLEGRGSMPILTLAVTDPADKMLFVDVRPQRDGSFTITLPEGEWRVGNSGGEPSGYRVKSMAYGSLDLRAVPLKVNATDSPAEFRITVTAPELPPVRVGGRVVGMENIPASSRPISIRLTTPGAAEQQQATVSADGRFVFAEVFAGTHTIELDSSNLNGLSMPITVETQPLTDVQLVVPPLRTVIARMVVEGGGPLPRVWLILSHGDTDAMISVIAQSDGTARVAVPAEDARAEVFVPPSYTLKSLTYGSADLGRNLLSTRAGKPDDELQITLLPKTKPQTGVTVRGRVIGLPAGANNIQVELEGTFTAPKRTPVNPDGTFTFTQVFEDRNVVRLLGTARGPVEIAVDVSSKDVSGVEIVFPDNERMDVAVTCRSRPIPRGSNSTGE